jgi:DNA-directed RNA polymerase omega subunit
MTTQGVLMKPKIFSSDINVQKCVKQVGGNQFNLVLVAAARAREIAKIRYIAQKNNLELKFPTKTMTQALHDIENPE